MIGFLSRFLMPGLMVLPPEIAHALTIRALEAGFYPHDTSAPDPRLQVTVWGQTFPNPLGIAAGFDKDARVPDAVLKLGCGFAEIGTVTPKPQPGNPAPRVFRLIADHAVINSLGFNSAGHDATLANLTRSGPDGIIGINIGANKISNDRTEDYVQGLAKFYSIASYFTANISSPNTPGLRDLQAPKALDDLLTRLLRERDRLATETGIHRPVVIKISPDIAEEDLPAIVETITGHRADAIAISNTTFSRTGLIDEYSGGKFGGLSGRPIFHRTTVVLARVYQLTGGTIPLIGIGGIDSAETAVSKIEAGAALIQLYTGLIFQGSRLIPQIKTGLAATLEQRGLTNISELTGTKAADWAKKSIESG